jgi:Histidine kinase
MSVHEFIFSNKRSIRIGRHITFWTCWYLYMACTQLRNQTPEVIGMKNFIIYQLAVSLNRVLLQMVFCYITVYILFPLFFVKKKYAQFTAWFILTVIGEYWLTYFDFTYLWYKTYLWLSSFLPHFYDAKAVKPLSPFLNRYYIIYSHVHFTGSLVSCGIILSVKYYKNWYQKQRENASLINENSQAELQLLKAEVHPHFLFNTLNNIYSLTLDDSPEAAVAVKKLSGMVKYMINDGAAPFVPVDEEINRLLDYIGLEKIRYGNRLQMNVDIRHSVEDNRLIAPLLMIPFVENCFKHGASKMIEKAKIDLFIEAGKDWFEFRISNNKSVINEQQNPRIKIGLTNVRKRLELIYPSKHVLTIQSTEELFTVLMKVNLKSQNVVFNKSVSILPTSKIISHAS